MSLPNSIESIYDIVRPNKGQRITLPKPYGSADSLIIANWIKKKNNSNIEKKGVKRLIICNSQETADRIHEEVNYLIPNKNVKLFSD